MKEKLKELWAGTLEPTVAKQLLESLRKKKIKRAMRKASQARVALVKEDEARNAKLTREVETLIDQAKRHQIQAERYGTAGAVLMRPQEKVTKVNIQHLLPLLSPRRVMGVMSCLYILQLWNRRYRYIDYKKYRL